MRGLVRAQIRDYLPSPARSDPHDAVRDGTYPVRAASTREQGVELVVDEGDARHAADQTSEHRTCLARGQRVHHRRDHPRRADLRDPPTEARIAGAARVRGGGPRDLPALAYGGVRAAEATFSDVQIPVRAEREATRVIEPRREHRYLRRLTRALPNWGTLARCRCVFDEPPEGSDRRNQQETSHAAPLSNRQRVGRLPTMQRSVVAALSAGPHLAGVASGIRKPRVRSSPKTISSGR